jgi:hypothetical protein
MLQDAFIWDRVGSWDLPQSFGSISHCCRAVLQPKHASMECVGLAALQHRRFVREADVMCHECCQAECKRGIDACLVSATSLI